MPFKSVAQRGYLFAHNPKVAKEFARATPPDAQLPEKVGDKPAAPKKKRSAIGAIADSMRGGGR